MPPPYCYDFPRPAVTVDAVVFTLEGDALRVLLIRRKSPPFLGQWAIPGGFLDIDEPIEQAARRELREETGLELPGPVDVLGVFGDPGRDPRGRTISIAHVAAVPGPAPEVNGGDDAEEAAWLDPREPRPLAFDHATILASGLTWLECGLKEGHVGLDLLPQEFEDRDVKRLFRAIAGTARGAPGWTNRMSRAGRIRPIPRSPHRFRKTGP